MKRMIFWYLTMFCFTFLNYAIAKADEPLILVKARINERHIQYNELLSKYEEIWIGYTIVKNMIATESGNERFIIERAYYYYKKDGDHILLGSLDKMGLYDKNGICIYEAPRIPSDFIIAGICSSLLEWSFSPALILQSKNNSDIYRETDGFIAIGIDTQQGTIKILGSPW